MEILHKSITLIEEIDEWISVVYICCILMDALPEFYSITNEKAASAVGSSLQEKNFRFEQHSVGYQFENGSTIRKDSALAHAYIVKPALALLTAPAFAKANGEFMVAHRHYRTGAFKDAITAANRSFERKHAKDLRSRRVDIWKRRSATELVTLVNSKGLFTHDLDKGFSAYVAMMKTGLPDVRNNAGAHGDGASAKDVTSGIARFASNLTASNIVF